MADDLVLCSKGKQRPDCVWSLPVVGHAHNHGDQMSQPCPVLPSSVYTDADPELVVPSAAISKEKQRCLPINFSKDQSGARGLH